MRAIGIEEVLRWAYRDELPKVTQTVRAHVGPLQFGQAWGGVERYGELLTLIDAPENMWGVVPDFTATTDPHPDAVMVAEAVADLDGLDIDLPDDWYPLADLGDLGALGAAAVSRATGRLFLVDADGRRRLRSTPRRLVVKHAIMGGSPVWEADVPALKVECGANGRAKWFERVMVTTETGSMEVEVDGYDAKRHAPRPGAYRKEFLDPDPADAAISRGEYEVWHAALGVLVEELAGRLTSRDVAPCPRPVRPWEGTPIAPRRVLPDLISTARYGAERRAVTFRRPIRLGLLDTFGY